MAAPTLDKELKGAVVSVAASATGELVAAPGANKRIVVVNYAIVCLNDGQVTFKSATTAVSGAMETGDNGGVSFPGVIAGPAFFCGVNEALNLTTGAQVGGAKGHVTYYVDYVGP